MSDNVALNPDTPRVDALIDKIMTQHPGYGKSAQAAYYEAVHQELAPLARQLERELVAMREERDSQQRVCIKVMEERDEWAAKWHSMRRQYAELRYPGMTGIVRANAPLPPETRVDTMQDRIHQDSGIGRVAKSVKVPK